MKDRAFLDTNILVYAYDRQDPGKQTTAQKIIVKGIEQENLVLSVQVLSEFFTAVTRHIPTPMTPEEARVVISTVSILPVQELDLPIVDRAIDLHLRYQIAYWDALIVSAAERSQCTLILSEDLSDGQSYGEILVRDPFRG